MLPVLVFDGTCPVCVNYVRMLRRKLPADRIVFQPTSDPGNEFKYVMADGGTVYGNAAIDALAKDFPQVLDYFWMLPEKYKVAGLKVAYAVGAAVRRVVKKGCNCGKK